MSEAGHSMFGCDACGKQYRWKPELAGKKAKCSCGAVMTVPASRPGESDDLYDLAPDPEPPKPPAHRHEPATGDSAAAAAQPVRPAAARVARPAMAAPAATAAPVIPYRRGLSQVEREHEDPADIFEGNKNKNLYLPLGLILVGTMIEYGRVIYIMGDASRGFVAATVAVGVSVLVNVVLMLIGILIAAKALGMAFGPVWTAILKLCAIAIGPGALGALVSIVLGAGLAAMLIGWLVSLVLYWTLLSVLFDLDANETMWCVLVIGLVRYLSGCILAGVLLSVMA